jgi:hypothetical protein
MTRAWETQKMAKAVAAKLALVSALSLIAAVGSGPTPVWAAETTAAVVDPVETAELSRTASWSQPPDAAVGEQLQQWLATRSDTNPERRGAATAAWNEADGDRLDRLMRAVAAVDDRAATLRNEIDRLPPAAVSRLADQFDSQPEADFGDDVAALWTARQLVRLDRYDEAAPLLVKRSVEASPDPATLLFCRAACEFWMLQADAASETIARLLEREAEIPVRYAQLARLLEADVASLEQDSLDHISRRMRDITRRLELGHAGKKIRAVQDGVIASLDKLIKKIEDQQQQQQAGGAGSSGGGGQGRPMDDSQLAGGKGRGEVTSRDLDNAGEWGDLPPREREEALQQIGRDYPAHYREAIEQYFKRLAAGDRGR